MASSATITRMAGVVIHPNVREALKTAAPIVALESAVITSGLPRQPAILPKELQLPGWNSKQPINVELARAMERTIREAGATPATIAVIDGSLRIGLDENDLVALAAHPLAAKAASNDLAHVIATGRTAGLTVSATLAACATTHSAPSTQHSALPGLRVLATGGIGGVHRNWQQHPDISADLRALATTPVCVVCSGGKSILDLPATLESLQTLAIPVIGYRTNRLPQFQSAPPTDALPLANRVDDPQSIAKLCALHWSTLNQRTGILLANPVPDQFAMDAAELDDAIERAEKLAAASNITGPERTPFLLAQTARLTNNRSLAANLALLIDNARLASAIAVSLAQIDHVA